MFRIAIPVILLALSATLASQAQIKNFRVGANVNHTMIGSVTKTFPLPELPPSLGYYNVVRPKPTLTETYGSGNGFSVFGSGDISIGGKYFLRSGINITVLNFSRSVSIELPDFEIPTGSEVELPGEGFIVGYPMGSIYGAIGSGVNGPGTMRWKDVELINIEETRRPVVENARLIWLQVPVLVGRSFAGERVQLSAGFVTTFLLNESSKVEQRNLLSTDREGGTTKVLAGSKLAVSYALTRRLGVEADGQYFLSPLYSKEYQVAGKSFAGVVSAGLTYRISN